MKTSQTLLLSALALGFATTLAQAEPKKKLRVLAEAEAPGAKVEKRVIIRHAGLPREMVKVTFLGVETGGVSADLGAQLNLATGTGLVVRHVLPDGPAAGVLQAHDILTKLDDQLLIAPRQFAVLVRNHKVGDEVTLTYIRGGKEATAKVKLAEHEVPKMAFFGVNENGQQKHIIFAGDGQMDGKELKRTLSLLDARGQPAPTMKHVEVTAPGFSATTVNTANSNIVFSDDMGSLELTIKDGKKTLVAKNAKGESIYSGPIDTPEQRKALSDSVRTRLDKIEGMKEFTFHIEESDSAEAMKPTAQGIALPLPAAPEWTEEADSATL